MPLTTCAAIRAGSAPRVPLNTLPSAYVRSAKPYLDTIIISAAAQHVANHIGAEAAGKRQDVQARHGAPAHGEHVGQRIGGGNGAELVRIVHHGREEVQRQHGCVVFIHLVYGGVVGGIEPQQNVRVRQRRRNVFQYFREVARTPLRRSTAFFGQRGQAYAFAVVFLFRLRTSSHSVPFLRA